jgi:Protein of unknown function (DUF3263)
LIGSNEGGRLDRMGLSERDQAILEFEGSWWTLAGPKEAAIRDRFGISATSYRRILANLMETEDAESADPLLVRRLRRDRDLRRRARYERRPPGGADGRGVP